MDFSKLNVIEKVFGGAGYVAAGVAGSAFALGEYIYRRTVDDQSHADANRTATKTAGRIADMGGEIGAQAAPEAFNALVGHLMGNALGGKSDSCKCATNKK